MRLYNVFKSGKIDLQRGFFNILRFSYSFFLLIFIFSLVGCEKKEEAQKSSVKSLNELKISGLSNVSFTYDETKKTYTATVPKSANIKALYIDFSLPVGAVSQPKSGSVVDFSNPVTFTVTAEDGSTQSYIIIVVFSKSSEKALTELKVDNLSDGAITYNAPSSTYSIKTTTGTSVSEVPVFFKISDGATVDPKSGEVKDFTNPVKYTVTAEDGSSQIYTIQFDRALKIDRIEYRVKNNPLAITTFDYESNGNIKSLITNNYRIYQTEAAALNNKVSTVFTYDAQGRVVKSTSTYDDKPFRELYSYSSSSVYAFIYNSYVDYNGTSDTPSKISTDYFCGWKDNYLSWLETFTFEYNANRRILTSIQRNENGCGQALPKPIKMPGNMAQKNLYEFVATGSYLKYRSTQTSCITQSETPCNDISQNKYVTNYSSDYLPTYKNRALLPQKNLVALLNVTGTEHPLNFLYPGRGVFNDNSYGGGSNLTFTAEGYVKTMTSEDKSISIFYR